MCAMVLLAYHSVITYYLGKRAEKRKHNAWLKLFVCVACLCMHCVPMNALNLLLGEASELVF